MARIEINGVELFYKIRGSGPPLLLLMGWTANSDWWSEIFLSAMEKNYQLIMLDNRGSGRSESSKGFYRIEQFADDAAQLLTKLDIEKAHVFGVSLGGMIAQSLALRHPDKVDKLILGCTTCGPKKGKVLSIAALEGLLRFSVSSNFKIPRLLMHMAFSRDTRDHIIRTAIKQGAIAPIGPKDQWKQFAAFWRFNTYPDLPKIKHTTLVITGTKDLLIPPKNSKIIQKRIPNSKLVEFRGVSHAFVSDAPDKTHQALSEFRLRKDFLMKIRTPDERFENLSGYNFTPNYLEHHGMRIHYLDEGPKDSNETIVCLHGEPSWSYLYRKMIPALSKDNRVIAPDLIGFGKSDKYTDPEAYTFEMHIQTLNKLLIDHLDLKNMVLVVQDWGGLLGLPFAMKHQDRVSRLVIMNTELPGHGILNLNNLKGLVGSASFMTWRTFASLMPNLPVGQVVSAGTWRPFQLSKSIRDAYDAPFPDKRYKVGASVFPKLVPLTANSAGASEMRFARQELKKWQKPALIMFGTRDPIMGKRGKNFHRMIPGAQSYSLVEFNNASHFLQEDIGENLAKRIVNFMKN